MPVPASDDVFSSPGHDRQVERCWERLLAGVGEAAPPRRPIGQSWRRCLAARVDHRRYQAPLPLPDPALQELRRANRDLIEASAPVMAMAREFLIETGTVMVLTDPSATVLTLEGDRSFPLRNATENIHLLPGADWSEASCGTNAIGTALVTGGPIQVHSTEHYCAGIKRWTCSASVIRDPFDGTVLGSLDVSGLRCSYNRHNMALVVAAATRIENRLAQTEIEFRYRLLDRCLWSVPAGAGDRVVIFDRLGRAIKASTEGEALLRERGVESIDEVRVDLEPAERARMIELTGRRTVPQIFIGETHVGGCDDLIALDRRG
jgi:transcriptional regulator of acetoin/glycerol metabolism